MASSGKKKTTIGKRTRENKLRQRRLDKHAKKDARKQAPADHPQRPGDTLSPTTAEAQRAPADSARGASWRPGGCA
jgi:hypothetical protein